MSEKDGTGPGVYDHLGKEFPVTVETEIDLLDVARAAEKGHYGTHRLITAIIQARVERATRENWPDDHHRRKLIEALTKMLKDGIY